MNVTRINELADFIESGERPWDISEWSLCFCGQSQQIGGDAYGDDISIFLGVDDNTIVPALISPPGWLDEDSDLYSREKAVAVLRNLAKTGEVNWSVQPQERI